MRFWRLNESLLQKREILEEVNRELKFYFQTNTTADCSPGAVWEAHKVVIRGVFIKHGARIKEEAGKQLDSLLVKLHIAESQHKNSLSPLAEAELSSLRSQINDLLGYRAKAALQKCWLIAYESGDCWRILARAVKDLKMQTYIPHIKMETATKVNLPHHIANTFRDYYKSLHNLPTSSGTQHLMEAYLSSSQIPTLSPESVAELEAPITSEELELALNSTKPGKALGPDGFTLQFYKTLLSSLSPHMITFFNEIGKTATFLSETMRAHITVIPKEGKDPLVCSSYRPISLLNTDLKLFTKILAT